MSKCWKAESCPGRSAAKNKRRTEAGNVAQVVINELIEKEGVGRMPSFFDECILFKNLSAFFQED
jgi:hypothetical protein